MTNVSGGLTLSEIILEEDKIFDALTIRDTANHDSSISNNQFYVPRTIIIENTLNQIVTIIVQGSRYDDFNRFVTIGNSFTISAGGDDYVTIADYFPFLRLRASCLLSPSSGSLSAYVLKRS